MRKKRWLTAALCAALMVAAFGCSGEEVQKVEDFVDFFVEMPEGRPLRILQLTDTQIIDASQVRRADRLSVYEKNIYAKNKIDEMCFDQMRRIVERAEPDLILLTGDIVYGEFDDNGSSFEAVVALMESFGVPWAPVYGNHDNESAMGVEWQNQQFLNAEHCLFRTRPEIIGNGNYTIGIRRNGELLRVIYMMDSDGCGYSWAENTNMKLEPGFFSDQTEWLARNAAGVDLAAGRKVPSILAMHIPPKEYETALIAAGYQDERDAAFVFKYTLGAEENDFETKDGDFGAKGEKVSSWSQNGFWEVLKSANIDSVFAGHCHQNNYSVMYEGIRLTFGLKTGYYDYHTKEQTGGTLIRVEENATFMVEHLYDVESA